MTDQEIVQALKACIDEGIIVPTYDGRTIRYCVSGDRPDQIQADHVYKIHSRGKPGYRRWRLYRIGDGVSLHYYPSRPRPELHVLAFALIAIVLVAIGTLVAGVML